MFVKKVKRGTYRRKGDEEERGKEGRDTGQAEGEVDSSQVLQEALELRKLRKRPKGLSVEELIRPEEKEEAPQKAAKTPNTYGLMDNASLNFAQQSNAMDTDRLMKEFVERELRKRRGEEDVPAKDNKPAYVDPTDELYSVPSHLKIEEKPVNEGNVTLSTSMLTAIPEVDLGIEAKIKCIEETEKAKRLLAEQKRGGGDGIDRLLNPRQISSQRCESETTERCLI
ncbi:hepatocellular carcinoma-associated antigen 59-domain-containing protein [Cladochytrium replicatum]|nr:hepatocellular carcinoma-associated antigen 59-domain-containing protein [Cladochytrium replicatum]